MIDGGAIRLELRPVLTAAPRWSSYLRRANTIAEAITAHAGQGAAALDRFQALTAAQRDELLAFLRAL